MKLKTLLLLLFLSESLFLISQDEHFSQFYAIPMHMNPALTGAYEGTYRMNLVYRDQWNNAFGSPYRTFAAGGDTRITMRVRKQATEDRIGVGLFFVNDVVDEFQFNTNKISAYGAYHKRLGNRTPSYLGAGLKMGVITHNINYDNLDFEDEFNQIDGYDQATSESLPQNNFGTFDMGVGINYSVQTKKATYYLGVGADHLNNPSYSFFNLQSTNTSSVDVSQRLETKLAVHISMDRKLNYNWDIQPRVIYQSQGEHNQIDVGTNLEYTFKSRESSLFFGMWLTGLEDLDGFHMENITPLLGVRKNQFIVGLSYDIHLRDALTSPFGFNTFEFSIRFSGVHDSEGAYCPTF